MSNIYAQFTSGKKQLAILIDPDKHTSSSLKNLCHKLQSSPFSFVFVGGSLMSKSFFDEAVEVLKLNSGFPVVIFPGNSFQVSAKADAILFLSLLSGRNPEYLIGQQVQAAPLVKSIKLEAIPTAYLLIDGGKISTTAYITQSVPIPADKPDIAVATAVAAELLGMKMIYLEAGSGALQPVPAAMISAVKQAVNLPLVVGGGIRSAAQVKAAYDAGADVVVVGTAIEEEEGLISLL